MVQSSEGPTPIEEYHRTRLQMASDPHRPGYHFLPPSGWMDDANGVIQIGGRYHLFYQWIPNSAHRNGGPFHWGHAVSDDLVHWSDLPIAVSPSPDGPDRQGCWSGSAVVHNGIPTLLYTGRGAGGQFGVCMATSTDTLATWRKRPNPVISEPPQGYASPGGDPHVWCEGDQWYCLLSTSIPEVGGAAMLYRSRDLIAWEFLGPLLSGRKEETEPGWELPKFIPIGTKHMLTLSTMSKSIYFVGDYREHRFTPNRYADLDLGGHFYAPYPFVDEAGRTIMIT